MNSHLAGVGALCVGADGALAAGPGEGHPALVHVHAPPRPRGIGLVPGGAGAVADAAGDLDALGGRLALGGALAAAVGQLATLPAGAQLVGRLAGAGRPRPRAALLAAHEGVPAEALQELMR